MSILGHPAPFARPAAILAGVVAAVVAFAGGEALGLGDAPLLGVTIALGLAAAALTRRAMHRRALERDSSGHNAER